MRDPREKLLRRAERQERRCLQKPAVGKGLADKVPVPDKAREALTAAFVQAFRTVHAHGDGIIRRGLDPDAQKAALDALDRQAAGRMSRRHLRAVGAQARKTRRNGSGIVLAEGMGLGLIGVGLPDIPIFLGVLLRGIYRISLSYGFDFRLPEEQMYVLQLLACAASPDAAQQQALDQTARQIQSGELLSPDWTKLRQQAAERLAEGMLTAKFIQGLPVVGVAGGLYNLPLYRRVTGYAEIEYRKRYLWKQEKP